MTDKKIELLNALVNPVKKHLGGEVLSEAQVVEFFEYSSRVHSNRGLTSHTFSTRDSEGVKFDEVCFFTHNHIYGYTIIPDDFVSCSFAVPGHCVAREGVEDGTMDTFDKWKVVHGQGTRFIWSVQELVDFIIDEYLDIVKHMN